MKKLLLLLVFVTGMVHAQTKIVNIYGDDAYYEISEYKVKFFYKYTPEDDVSKIEYGYGGILTPSTILHADVKIVGDYVVLSRIRSIQQTGYKFNIQFEDLITAKNATNRKGVVRKRFIRWTDILIEAIRRY